MYNLLIVEDETIEREALCEIIQNNFRNVLNVHSAETGDEAIDIASQVKPEIILMDIHLGSDNGIDISEQILEDLSSARVIVLTAYDNFDYAQKALRLGIKDYLLKPVATNELVNLIRDQLQIIKEAQEDMKKISLITDSNINLEAFWEKQFISMLNANNFNANNIQTILSVLKINYDYAFIIKLEIKYDFDKVFLHKISLNNKVVEILRNAQLFENVIIDLDGMSEISIIVFRDTIHLENIHEEIVKSAQLIKRTIALKMQSEIRLGISGPIYCAEEFARGYNDARFALNNGCESINYYMDLKYENARDHYPYELESKIFNALFCEANDEVNAEFQKFVNEIVNPKRNYEIKGVFIKLLADIFIELSVRFAQTLPNAKILIERSFFEVSKNTDIDDIIKRLGIAFSELGKLIHNKNLSKKAYIVDRLKEFIDQNYHADITLDMIADKFKVSSYYICRVFKKEKDININSYITLVRINKAKELLSDHNNMIKSISIDVGLSDPNYFCKVFKKVTGLTPSEFRSIVVAESQK